MNAPPPQERQETKQRILDASVELFQRKGFRATSLAEIADAVGIRKASLYYHMPNKAMLLEEVFREVTTALTEPPSRDLANNLDARQRLALVIANHVRFHIEHSVFMRIFWRERHELPAETYKTIREREKAYEVFLEDLIGTGQREGLFDPDLDPAMTRYSTLGMLTTIYRWPHPEQLTDAYEDSVVDHVTKALLSGLEVGRPLEDEEHEQGAAS